MSDEAVETLQRGYLQPGETPLDMYTRLANTCASYYKGGLPSLNLSQEDIRTYVLSAFMNGWLSPASPVAANFGAKEGLPSSCIGINVSNSIDGIFSAIHEGAMLSKNGAGLGVNVSNLIGPSKVNTWAKGFDYMATAVAQSGVRRGAVALYLDINHPDINEFLNSKDLLKGDNREKLDCNIAVILDKPFMARLRAGDSDARNLFFKIMELRMKFGSPYIMFKHNAQDADPTWYKEKGLKTEHSQLCCLLGSELVVTNKGPIPIADLVGKKVDIWDGYQWVSNQSFEQKGIANTMICTYFSDGTYLYTTENHRFIQKTTGKAVFAKDLWSGFLCETLSPSLIKEVAYTDTVETEVPVYCTTVPTTGKFALENGIITGNSEIFLHSDADHTYTCMLSSFNLDKYDEWRLWRCADNVSLPMIGVIFMDSVVTEYINKAKHIPGLEKAVRFTEKSRALALGTLGYHSYLMKNMLPFESSEAGLLNVQIHKFIRDECERATTYLAKDLGEPEWCRGYNRRHTHLTAIAPTTTNSVLCNAGTPGVEPQVANYYVAIGAKGSFERKNKYLDKIITERFANTQAIWAKIRERNGSIQGMNEFTQEEQDIFKTAYEIDQRAIVIQAGHRQRYIDQGQSINLFFNHDADPQYIVDTHLLADSVRLKSLYYVRSTSEMSANGKTQIENVVMYTRDDCPYCHKAKELLDSFGIPYRTVNKPDGRVPEIWIDGEKLDDGFTSLEALLLNKKPSSIEIDKNSCGGCEG